MATKSRLYARPCAGDIQSPGKSVLTIWMAHCSWQSAPHSPSTSGVLICQEEAWARGWTCWGTTDTATRWQDGQLPALSGHSRRAEKQALESGARVLAPGRRVPTGWEEQRGQGGWEGGHLGPWGVGRIGGMGDQSLAETDCVLSVLMAPPDTPPQRASKDMQGMEPPGASRKNQPCSHHGFSPARPFWTSCLQSSKIINVCCFKPLPRR